MSRRVIIMSLGALAAFVGGSAGVLVSLHEDHKPKWDGVQPSPNGRDHVKYWTVSSAKSEWQDHWTPEPKTTATCEGIPTVTATCNVLPKQKTFYYVTNAKDERNVTWLSRDFSFVCKDGSQSKEPCPSRGARGSG